MAEALLRKLYGNAYEAHSAGTQPTNVNPFAVRVIEELGISMSGHRAKSIDQLGEIEFDLVVTVCDIAKESCPFVPGGRDREHKSFPDPSSFVGSEKETLAFFRTVRDRISDWLRERFGTVDSPLT
jgi:arsenate reductase